LRGGENEAKKNVIVKKYANSVGIKQSMSREANTNAWEEYQKKNPAQAKLFNVGGVFGNPIPMMDVETGEPKNFSKVKDATDTLTIEWVAPRY
jgi:hypothetical protein